VHAPLHIDDALGQHLLAGPLRLCLGNEKTMCWPGRNTLPRLIEIGGALNKTASETIYFEFLVLAFRVFEF
jgi:hypothetical protein